MLSIIIPAWNEADNLAELLPSLRRVGDRLKVKYEILVADAGSHDGTKEICHTKGARYLNVGGRGYGLALQSGFNAASGEFLITMDADLSHPSDFIHSLWENRKKADVIIASRYVKGGRRDMPFSRSILSRLLNWTFKAALHVPVKDLSSGFRLYRASSIRDISPSGRDFNILQEIIIIAFAEGYRIVEVPFHYRRRKRGSSHARLIAFGLQYVKTLGRMWRLRNSIRSGDYDSRAYDSLIPLQRWWQRQRYRHILGCISTAKPALDVGCGSSRILNALHPKSVGLDPSLGKLRHARRYGRYTIAGALPHLPVRSNSFSTLICSQVIEHIPVNDEIFSEFCRVLSNGGKLILGTPDYGRIYWRIIEALYHRFIPGGYADEHITHYTKEVLTRKLKLAGFKVVEEHYIIGAELILCCVKTRKTIGQL